MVFVTVKTDIVSPRGVAITEEQDIVYREDPDPNAPPPPPQRAPGTAVWKKAVTPDVVILFRYSALTFNGHRIHYDHPYVTGVEGYPGLVMNGGLTTLLVHELVREQAPKPLSLHRFAQCPPALRESPVHGLRRTVERRLEGQAVGGR